MPTNDFILDWLNNDLKLQPNIINITNEFSNGYRFAEVLFSLNEISQEELQEFKNSKNDEEIKNNFKKIKILLKEKFNLEIREEEFNEVSKYDLTKATIILYKIKNSVNKKKINFLEIKTFAHQPTKEEIRNKVKEIMDSDNIHETIDYSDDEMNEKIQKKRNDIKRITQAEIDLNSIASESNEIDSDNISKIKEYYDKEISSRNISNYDSLNINIDNSNKNSKYNNKNIYNSLNDTNTINKTYESNIGNQKAFKTVETNDLRTSRNKKILKPITSTSNFKNMSINSNINILPKILPKINLKASLGGRYIMNSNTYSSYSIFNKNKKNFNTITNCVSVVQSEIDFDNDIGMTKIKELKDRLNKKKLDDIKKQEEIKNELKIKKCHEFEILDKYRLDFVNKAKNPLYKFTKFSGVNLFNHSNSKYNSSNIRLIYSKNLKEKIHQEEIEQQILYARKIMNRNTELMNKRLKEKNRSLNFSVDINKYNLEPFNKRKYLKDVNKLDREEFGKYLNKKIVEKKNDFPIIKKLLYFIIELSEDIYEYQKENEKEIIELEDFKIFSEFFINNKHKYRREYDKEVIEIKNADSDDDIKIDINNLKLNDEILCLIQDYINYIGIWNDEKIINNELRGYKYDIKKIKADLPIEYEPKENEIEDITLPIKISDNYTLGNTILKAIETKYSNNKDNKSNDLIKDNINYLKDKEKEEKSLSKWNYIPYKLSIIGFPLSGRRFIAENLVQKYPNIKIYSIKKIFRDYYIEYKNLTEQIDENPKYKSLKPNQIIQMKEEREKKLVEFTPILNIIKPFIDLINEEKRRKKEKEEEEEKIKKEKELLNMKNNAKNLKGKGKSSKSQNKLSSALKKKNISTKKAEFVEENINEDLKKIPSDEILFNILKYTIESDFPKKSKQDVEKDIIEYQTKIFENLKQIENLEKQKQESKKHSNKEDTAINNLQKDIENLKLNSVEGFILVDYPCNINQTILLENYLTGYVDELEKPKSEKNKIICNLSNFLDFKIHPKKNKVIKRAGIDFVINLINQEKEVDERFLSKKYDPISDKIYTKSDLSEENKNKPHLDKKIIERLVNDVPYLTQENYNFYKDEYKNNISLISNLYNKFGMYVDVDSDKDNEIRILGIDFNEKEIKKCFQSIELDTNMNQNLSNNEEKNKEENENITHKKKIAIKKSNKKLLNSKNNVDFELEEKNKNKILDFICNNIINWLYKEKDKSDKIIFYSNHPEYNINEENDRIKFDEDLKDNQINNDKGKKTVKVQNNNSSLFLGESLINTLVHKNSEFIIKEIFNFNQKYNKNIGKFIFLINKQKNGIYKRLNLVQKKFRDFLNLKTKKKKVIHTYVSKYNEFFKDQNFFKNKKANEEFSKDIEDVNNNLWLLINEKEKESVKELDSIKYSGFIEKELHKFYNNLKELFIIETERFLIMINSILFLYSKNTINTTSKEEENDILFKIRNIRMKGDSQNTDQLNIDGKNNEKKERINNEKEFNFNNINIQKNNIIKNTFYIDEELNNKSEEDSNSVNKEKKYEIKLNNLISQISRNIEIILMNCLNIILEYQETIDTLIKEIKSVSSTTTKKKYLLKKSAKYSKSNNSSMMTSIYGGIGNSLHEKIVKMLKNEKNRYKYRISYLKSFANKYMAIITQTTQNIFFNVDQWIVTSISLQNDALNKIMSLLKRKLNEKKLIDEKFEIDTIEMDEFEKKIDENSEMGEGDEINLKPIDNSSVGGKRVYKKLNIDYLINDNFIDIKIEEINQILEEEDEDIIENKIYKIILPNELDKSINSSENNNSFGGGIKNRLKENDFYFDINKFYLLYKNLKKYEIEENIISRDLFYEVFIKQYFIDKYGENNEKENINLGINNINTIENVNDKNKKSDNKIKNEIIESEEDENSNSINDHLINHQNNTHNLNAICQALRMLNSKQFHKIYSLYQIPIEHKTPIDNNEKDNKDETKEKEMKNKEENCSKDINANNLEEKKNDKNINKYDEKVEYEIYLNTSEIFTILPLIGCRVLNMMEEEQINNNLKSKLIRGKYLLKKDFMEYHFWFEQDFEYQKEDILFQQMIEENNKQHNSNLGLEENKKMNIKEFLFNIWKDEKGNKMDFQKFISVLKINKYITDLNSLNEQSYYDVIFNSEK